MSGSEHISLLHSSAHPCVRVGLLVLALLLSAPGCSLLPGATSQLTQARLPGLPVRHELSDTPFIQQEAYQCGPASLAMIMGYHNRPVTPADLVPWVFTPDAQGSFPAEMDAVARQQGFLSYPVDRLEDVVREVAAGNPVLVLQNLATDWYPRWHFAVVVGYDLERQELVLRSGDLARRITEVKLFDTTWARGKRWARVILPPQQVPITARPERWQKAAADLEQTGPADAALAAFRSGVARWPDLAAARFGLATGLLAQGENAPARQEFETLLRQQPGLGAAWNNYAYVLNALGCPASAQVAVSCAMALAPEAPAFADSQRELQSTRPDAPGCGTLPLLPTDCSITR